jgi:hypothetical protein
MLALQYFIKLGSDVGCIPITTTTVFNQSNFLRNDGIGVIVVDKIVVS